MVHLSTPGADDGFFSTQTVRPADKPAAVTSRLIQLPRKHYKKPPQLATGFKSLDLSCRAPVRAAITTSDVGTQTFSIGIASTDLSSKVISGKNGTPEVTKRPFVKEAIIHSASATWIERAASARSSQFGTFDTRSLRPDADASSLSDSSLPAQENKQHVKFSRSFAGTPEIVVWLNRLHLASGGERNYRVRCYATNVTKTGFIAHIDTWGDSVLCGGGMSWIAFPRGKSNVDCGSFSTGDVRAWHDPRPENEGKVRFVGVGKENGHVVNGANGENGANGTSGSLGQDPTVLVALNMLDLAGNADLRVKTEAVDVNQKGFTWRLDTWGDSTMYAAGASWIALGFE